MYKGIILLLVFFIMITVLYKNDNDFRKVMCMNTFLTSMLILIIIFVLYHNNIKLNNKLLEKFSDSGCSDFSDREGSNDMEKCISMIGCNYDNSDKTCNDVENNQEEEEEDQEEEMNENQSIVLLLNNISFSVIEKVEDFKDQIKMIFDKLYISRFLIKDYDFDLDKSRVKIHFKESVNMNILSKIIDNIVKHLSDVNIPVKLKNGETLIYNGKNISILGFSDFVKDNEESSDIRRRRPIRRSQGTGEIDQSNIDGVGNIFAPKIVIKDDDDVQNRTIPQPILKQRNYEDAKANIMKAQHYRDYNNYGDLTFGNFEKSRVSTKCSDPLLDGNISTALNERTYYPGYSYMPPSNWNVPQQRPPVCTSQKKCLDHPVSVFDKGTPADALEYYGVGSILPNFSYSQETEYGYCPEGSSSLSSAIELAKQKKEMEELEAEES